MEELLSLKWNNHRSTFIHVLGILRDKELYTDATLACEGKFYSVHKLVLSTCSDYFSAMLDRTNCKNPVIVLKDIKNEDLEALLDYMYIGEVNVRQSDLATLIKAAECLRVKGLAVPDDEPPPPRKVRGSENQTRRGDTSGSPPAKRKRRSDVDDGRDDVRPIKQDIRHSPVPRPKSPSSNASSTPLSPVINRTTPQRQSTDTIVPLSPSRTSNNQTSNNQISNNQISNNQSSNNHEDTTETITKINQSFPAEQTEQFVKVEMDDAGGNEVETYDLSNDGAFKEEGNDDGGGASGGGESGGDLSNDLPEFLQGAAGPLQGAAFGHSSFSGASAFQPGDMSGWQGDGSNIGFPHLNFNATDGSSQQNAPGNVIGSVGMKPPFIDGNNKRVSASCQPTSVNLSNVLPLQRRHLVIPKPGDIAYDNGWYCCPFCDTKCIEKSKVRRHMRKHTGERPYKCPQCSYSATQNNNLKRHILIIHGTGPQ